MDNGELGSAFSTRRWIEPAEVPVPDELLSSVGGHPLVAKMIARRGILDPASARAFLDPQAYTPAAPLELPGLGEAAERLERAIRRGEAICVWGDFDVDGQTATTLLVWTLRELGARVSYHIPLRERESHGVSLPVLKGLLESGIRLVLTCDTGVSALEAIEYARRKAVDVVVTDHHELPPALPPAYALVNPRLLPGEHPLSSLPGVGVAYKLAEELLSRAGMPQAVHACLDLVALGIVADLAYLAGDVRYLLQLGLQALRRTPRLGLQALMELAEIDASGLSEEHIGFALAPRLNALGRLGDANPIVEFFTTQDPGRARLLALQLEGMNEQRKLLASQVFQAALAQIDADPSLLVGEALVLSHPSWPAGVIGIVAGRLAERYHKPAILLATPSGRLARGSGRSVEGINLAAALTACAHLLVSHGGHPMAAGLSMDAKDIPEFRQALNQVVSRLRPPSMEAEYLREDIHVEAYLPLADVSLELACELARLAPFGPGNPPPVFASREMRLISHAPLGRHAEHSLMIVGDEQGHTQWVIWWGAAVESLPEAALSGARFDLAYTLRPSTFRGQAELQVEWADLRVIDVSIPLPPIEKAIHAIDCRQEAQPNSRLAQVQAQPGLQVWCEGPVARDTGWVDRYHLLPGEKLVIWTIPPGPDELAAALESVKPRQVYLFAIDPHMDNPRIFLRRLAGLVKYSLRMYQGMVRVSSLAGATAQRESIVRVGLDWLVARGHLTVIEQTADGLLLAPGPGTVAAGLPPAESRLKALLGESAAYRAYFARADPASLLATR